jgi:hypothetical protein
VRVPRRPQKQFEGLNINRKSANKKWRISSQSALHRPQNKNGVSKNSSSNQNVIQS